MAVDNLISRKRLVWIANNFELSRHAKNRLKERTDTDRTIDDLILNSPLAWSQCRGKICIAFNMYEYIVVSLDREDKEKPATVLTFVNMEDSGDCVIDMFVNTYMKINHKGC